MTVIDAAAARACVDFPPIVNRTISQEMTLELTAEEHQALVRLLRRSIDEDRFPLAPRHAPIRAVLAKLEPPAPQPEPLPPRNPAGGRASVEGVGDENASADRLLFSTVAHRMRAWRRIRRPRPPCGQFWMIRRFTSAQLVPANAGAKAKNPVGSTLFSTPMVALLRDFGHKILRTCSREFSS